MAKSILSNNPGQLVTKAKVNVSDWTSYTPTFQGLGTVTNIDMKWRRVGANLEVAGNFSTGTGTGVEARISLPDGLVSSSNLPSISFAGKAIWNDAANPSQHVHGLIEPGVTYFTLGAKQTTQSQLFKINGNDYMSVPHNLSVLFSIPIQGWDSQAEFLAPQIQPKVAFIKDVKPNGTPGGTFNNGDWRTRDLNTLSGDTAELGITLSSNQFTLQPGKYIISAQAPARAVDGNKIKLRNITDSTDDIIGASALAENNTFHNNSVSLLEDIITITSPKTYEIQHRCQTSVATIGLGQASSVGVDEVYTTVKITKIS